MHGFNTRGSFVPAGILSPQGRFGRLFPDLDARAPTFDALADPMGAAGGPMDVAGVQHNGPLPAGFTFLAQFLDHDLRLRSNIEPGASSRPQRDHELSLAGARLGQRLRPRTDGDAYIYDSSDPNGEILLVNGTDLARNSLGKALIGDPRNDENMIVSQLELAFMKCHNAIVAGLRAGTFKNVFGELVTTNEDTTGGESTVFLAAQQLLRWHCQWMVVHESSAHLRRERRPRRTEERAAVL